MAIHYKAHQLQTALSVIDILREDRPRTLTDVTKIMRTLDLPSLRSQRRMLVGAARYIRVEKIQPTHQEWSEFTTAVAALPLAYDEATQGRYRYRIPNQRAMPFDARLPLVRAVLDQTPIGWTSSSQMRNVYQYTSRLTPALVKKFDAPGSDSLAQSLLALVKEKNPPVQSNFIRCLAQKDINELITRHWPSKKMTMTTNEKWLQAAYALARNPEHAGLKESILKPEWFDTKKTHDDTGLSLSFFELLYRLHPSVPEWLPSAFKEVVSHEKDAATLKRGWMHSKMSEDERFNLLLNLSNGCPSYAAKMLPSLTWKWTSSLEERKARVLPFYCNFGSEKSDENTDVIFEDAKEWLGTLLPELTTVLDLTIGNGPAQTLQIIELLKNTQVPSFELPSDLYESTSTLQVPS